MRFAPGEVLLRRYWRGGRISFMSLVRVAADDEFGLRLWLPQGYPCWRMTDTSGRTLHDAPLDELVSHHLFSQVFELRLPLLARSVSAAGRTAGAQR